MTITERSIYAEYGRTLVIRPGEDTEALFAQVCEEFENTRIEQDQDGSVLIKAPTGGESSNQNAELSMQLGFWAMRAGRGRAFDSSILFILPDNSKMSPDGSWVSTERLKTLSRAMRRQFLRVVPEFVIELKSPTDRFSELQPKMLNWRQNGVELGWLIHPDKRLVLIYRNGSSGVETVKDASAIEGEGAVSGFRLNLQPIWEGLAL
jgi:Uma2 family endonuclease